jgi:hypothetical protein
MSAGVVTDTVCVEVGAALGKLLVNALDGDTVCVVVGAALGKLVCMIGLADGTDVNALDGEPDRMRIRTIILFYSNCIALNNYFALLYIIKFRPSDNLLVKRKLQSITFGFILIKSIPISFQMPDNIRIQNQVSGTYA